MTRFAANLPLLLFFPDAISYLLFMLLGKIRVAKLKNLFMEKIQKIIWSHWWRLCRIRSHCNYDAEFIQKISY